MKIISRALIVLVAICSLAFATDENREAFDRGINALEHGDYKEAVEQFTQAIEIDPNYAEVYYFRSNSYAALGDLKKATQDARKACDLGSCDLLQELRESEQISD